MKEPTYGTTCGGVQECPLSLAPTHALRSAADGSMRWGPDPNGDMTDEAFTRQYAAILLRERGQ